MELQEIYTLLRAVQGADMERNDFFKACQNHARGLPAVVKYRDISYYPLAYQLAYNPDGTIRHTAVLQDLKSSTLVYCRLSEIS